MVWPAVRWDLQIHISKSQSGCFQELFFWPDKSSCPLINCHQLAVGPNAMAQTPLCQKTSILGEFALHSFPINASVSKSLLARSAQRCKVGSYFRALLFPISSEAGTQPGWPGPEPGTQVLPQLTASAAGSKFPLPVQTFKPSNPQSWTLVLPSTDFSQ